MSETRRRFLAKVSGFLAIGSLSLGLKADTPKEQFRMAAYMRDGTRVWASGIRRITVKPQGVDFESEPIVADRTMGPFAGSVLCRPDGKVVMQMPFERRVECVLLAGDTLTLIQPIEFDVPTPVNWRDHLLGRYDVT